MPEAAAQIRVPVEKVAPGTIRLERLLDAPVDVVWRYLTEAELREQWFMGGTDARPDAEFELLNDHDKLSDEPVPYPEDYAPYKGRVWSEKVFRFEPPQLRLDLPPSSPARAPFPRTPARSPPAKLWW